MYGNSWSFLLVSFDMTTDKRNIIEINDEIKQTMSL